MKYDFPAQRWLPAIQAHADKYEIDPYVIAAIITQESGGQYLLPDGSCNNYAIRVEKGFWRNYLTGIMRYVRSTKTPHDDRWAKYPDIYACSYGLGQIMLQTAFENGLTCIFPTELCDPDTNINLICKIMSKNLRLSGHSMSRALLRYNGGGDLEYPAHVLAHRQKLVDGRVFE